MSESSNLPMNFGGIGESKYTALDAARVVVLPVSYEGTVSYGTGTGAGAMAIVDASRNMELYEEETDTEVYKIGIHTLDEFRSRPTPELMMDSLYLHAVEILKKEKFLCTLGGEHSISAPIIRAHAERYHNLSVLQIDAHADLRDTYMGTPHNHACAMRRSLDYARLTQVGIRSMSTDEADAAGSLNTTIFYDVAMRKDPNWIERVVDSLAETVYLTIDVDGLDPAIMPATGTPEPGGLSWYEILALLRATMARRTIVACDVVELSPIPGLVAPNFLCAKLVYKILGYRFATGKS